MYIQPVGIHRYNVINIKVNIILKFCNFVVTCKFYYYYHCMYCYHYHEHISKKMYKGSKINFFKNNITYTAFEIVLVYLLF